MYGKMMTGADGQEDEGLLPERNINMPHKAEVKLDTSILYDEYGNEIQADSDQKVDIERIKRDHARFDLAEGKEDK
jgi:hypothetical protein